MTWVCCRTVSALYQEENVSQAKEITYGDVFLHRKTSVKTNSVNSSELPKK